MPVWLTTVLGLIGPMTEIEPAAVAFGEAIAAELKSADSVSAKVAAIGQDCITFATEIEKAFLPAAA